MTPYNDTLTPQIQKLDKIAFMLKINHAKIRWRYYELKNPNSMTNMLGSKQELVKEIEFLQKVQSRLQQYFKNEARKLI